MSTPREINDFMSKLMDRMGATRVVFYLDDKRKFRLELFQEEKVQDIIFEDDDMDQQIPEQVEPLAQLLESLGWRRPEPDDQDQCSLG